MFESERQRIHAAVVADQLHDSSKRIKAGGPYAGAGAPFLGGGPCTGTMPDAPVPDTQLDTPLPDVVIIHIYQNCTFGGPTDV